MDKMNSFGNLSNTLSEPEALDEEFLKSLTLVSTSKGMLRKFVCDIKGKKCYVKTGRKLRSGYSSSEPVAECMESEIGSLLGFNCIPYSLSYIYGDRLDNHEDVLVCVSESFLGEGESFIPMIKLLKGDKIRNDEGIYNHIVSKYPDQKIDIDRMIVLDFILNNTDRHLNNFGFVQGTGTEPRFSPFFDHGMSLLGDISDSDILSEGRELLSYEDSKPFRVKQHKAIELVKDVGSLGLNFSVDISKILDVVYKYSRYLSKERKYLVEAMLRRRYHYVRNLLADV